MRVTGAPTVILAFRELPVHEPEADMSKKILVVDDNFDVTEITKTILTAKGYEVRVAHNGQDALAEIHADPPALVILDVMMPTMSGLEVVERIKDHPATGGIPVIMCTAKAQDADFLEGYRCGADYYITKPFTAQQLLYGINLLLGDQDHVRS
jgi:DNA-binding response OmpR family regulator